MKRIIFWISNLPYRILRLFQIRQKFCKIVGWLSIVDMLVLDPIPYFDEIFLIGFSLFKCPNWSTKIKGLISLAGGTGLLVLMK